MGQPTILESISDRQRVCVLLRVYGWSYDEIADFLGVGSRMVRHDLESVVRELPGLLDHKRPVNKNRFMRLVYLMGLNDSGVELDELPEYLDALGDRALWLRARSRIRDAGEGSEAVICPQSA